MQLKRAIYTFISVLGFTAVAFGQGQTVDGVVAVVGGDVILKS